MKKKIIIIGSIIVMCGTFGLKALTDNVKELKMTTMTIREDTVEIVATATGSVQPVDKVEVGTQVSGVIERIYVDFNSQVKRGQLLAELDKATLSEKLIQAQAVVSSAKSELDFAQKNYDRAQQLYDAKAATQASYEDATNRLAQAQTSIANAKANLKQAQVNFRYAEIYSPIDGVILNRAVEQGQTVAASFNTPTLFTIANDLKRMKVEANVDEADIGQVRVGQAVRFTVDAYPDDVFTGMVQQVRLQPVVTNNVVTYTVIVEAPNPEEKLFPGMTASITVVVSSESGIVAPISSFNFNPSAKVMEKMNIQSKQTNPQTLKSIWVLAEGKAICREIETGLNDGVSIVVTKGLNVGDNVILSASLGKKK